MFAQQGGVGMQAFQRLSIRSRVRLIPFKDAPHMLRFSIWEVPRTLAKSMSGLHATFTMRGLWWRASD